MECALLNYEAKIRFRCVEMGRQQGYFANGSFSRVRKLSFDTKEGGRVILGGTDIAGDESVGCRAWVMRILGAREAIRKHALCLTHIGLYMMEGGS